MARGLAYIGVLALLAIAVILAASIAMGGDTVIFTNVGSDDPGCVTDCLQPVRGDV